MASLTRSGRETALLARFSSPREGGDDEKFRLLRQRLLRERIEIPPGRGRRAQEGDLAFGKRLVSVADGERGLLTGVSVLVNVTVGVVMRALAGARARGSRPPFQCARCGPHGVPESRWYPPADDRCAGRQQQQRRRSPQPAGICQSDEPLTGARICDLIVVLEKINSGSSIIVQRRPSSALALPCRTLALVDKAVFHRGGKFT